MSVFKWLHLSDFHFGKKPDFTYQQPLLASKIIDHVIKYSEENGPPDAIFITGDIANSGEIDEYSLFNDIILVPLMSFLGEDFCEKIFLVPGNHDVQRNKNRKFGRDEYLGLEDGNFEPSDISLGDRKILVERFSNFVNHSLATFTKDIVSADGSYYQRISVNGGDVSVIGINTSWLCRDEQDRGTLTPGIALLRAGLEKSPPTDVKFVLGHHPLDWVCQSHRETVKALLGHHNAIYLHGHMHEAWGKPEYVNGSSFMAIQAGAAFQAPEGSKWKNSLLWGQLNFDAKHIELKPYEWSFTEQNWKHSSAGFPEAHRDRDIWRYELPKSSVAIVSTRPVTPPGGWHVLTLIELDAHAVPLDDDDAVYFFDGATPSWKVALSPSIPRREVVNELGRVFSKLQGITKDAEPVICTLLAAGCEGKTTALLQTAYSILQANPTKKILYRKNSSRPFDVSQLLPVLLQHQDWLVVVDDADQVARALLHFVESGCQGYEGKIDFLLACRDSDWKSSEAISLPWNFCSSYQSVTLKDLSKVDAEKIVTAWAGYGARGLGDDFMNLETNIRVDKLRFYAKQESKSNTGAFFGALLLSRHNGDLLSHAEAMLSRLSDHTVENSKSLRDALGYIAAMHAEDFDKLSLEVLASVMGLTVARLQKYVINPLGQEAAATTTSTVVFTRHKYIAKAIVEVLETKFDVDISNIFIDLVISEVERSKNERVSNFDFWRFKMADALYEKGKSRLAIALCEAVLNADPENHRSRTKLAKFYRMEGSVEDSVSLFRGAENPSNERGFYREWSVCEGECRCIVESAVLVLFALSDDSNSTQLDIPDALFSLTGLVSALSNLHRRYADEEFELATDAAWSIVSLLAEHHAGFDMSGVRAFRNKVLRRRAINYTGVEAVNQLHELCKRLSTYKCEVGLPGAIAVSALSFDELKMLVRNFS